MIVSSAELKSTDPTRLFSDDCKMLIPALVSIKNGTDKYLISRLKTFLESISSTFALGLQSKYSI